MRADNHTLRVKIATMIYPRPFMKDGDDLSERDKADKVRLLGLSDRILALIDSHSSLNTQHGGDHYKKLGDYQPWLVLKNWLTPEEFRGYMKGTAIAYLAREKDKGGNLDIEKAIHTLQALLELEK